MFYNESISQIPPFHIYNPGDTLSAIASKYRVSLAEIVRFNTITDIRTLKPGDRIFIPRGIKKLRNVSDPLEMDLKTTALPGIVTIRSFITKGTIPLSVDFSTLFDFPGTLSPVWDFGNGRFSFSEHAHNTYLRPGEYRVSLCLADEKGQEIVSNSILISARKFNMNPDSDIFLTMDYVGEILDLSGRFYDATGNPVVFDSSFTVRQNPGLLQYIDTNRFLAITPGYTKVMLLKGNKEYHFYLFVSPFPTQHSVEPFFNWYKTQFNTGMYGNCGPACVAMAVHWATGKKITVVESREEIGLPIKSGALTYRHMASNFRYHRIKTYYTFIDDFDDMKDIIDRGNIAIILFNTTFLQPVDGDKTLIFVDRYYPDTTGHYIVLKGYSLDEKYFVAYDPIPGDWHTNTVRYTDGVSMIGRNRYFLVYQILQSIKGKQVLEIERIRGE
ncbi:MAG: C39 family peptidase [Spirochaetales bacterium]|nr:C39 family peptidase [Spirochaetales bacterium]